PDSAITFSAHGVNALAGMVACGGSIWWSLSVTSWAKDVTVIAPKAAAAVSSVLSFIGIPPLPIGYCYTVELFVAPVRPSSWTARAADPGCRAPGKAITLAR